MTISVEYPNGLEWDFGYYHTSEVVDKITVPLEDVRHMIAAAMFHIEEGWDEEEKANREMINGSIDLWHRIVERSKFNHGDCTKVPMTCSKCLSEEYLELADKIIKSYQEEFYKTVKAE